MIGAKIEFFIVLQHENCYLVVGGIYSGGGKIIKQHSINVNVD